VCPTQSPLSLLATVERYLRELSGEKLAAYIEAKFQSSAEDDVFPFSRELITEEYPLLAMFHERWCNRCTRHLVSVQSIGADACPSLNSTARSRCNEFRKAFETAASQTSGHVMFMEVECSTGADAQKFCDEHAIDGFPSLVLTGGEHPARTAAKPTARELFCEASRCECFFLHTDRLVALLLPRQEAVEAQGIRPRPQRAGHPRVS
jgi:hypothetical protein